MCLKRQNDLGIIVSQCKGHIYQNASTALIHGEMFRGLRLNALNIHMWAGV